MVASRKTGKWRLLKVIAMVLRFYSCLFALLAGLFMTGVSSLLLLNDAKNFKLDMLPFWKGESALYGMLVLGLLGIAAALLGLVKKVKPLLVLYTVIVFALMIYGFFLSPVYRFSGAPEAKSVAWVAVAALIAVVGAFMQYREARRV
ncbi:hypothetical protein [uncultured Paludibaculum sp.]|uniref:hypothetical protein n=1 Tax=uncultured Paludibaculum sp. TaxID=1765020 RepID=UPI002AAAC03A|nr:hypothetical protein [uncultured Paludibaculum sp.]